MITNDNKNLVQWAMDFALKNGCQASKVSLYNGSTTSFEIRDRKIDRLHQASENSLVVQLYVDGRFGSFSTNRLDKSELEKFIRDNIDATRYLAEDKARTLPDASRYYKGGLPDLQLIDPDFDTVQPDVKKDLALQACEEIMGKDERIISASAAYGDGIVADETQVIACLPRLDLRLCHVGDDLSVFEFDDPVAVDLGKFPIVRNDDDELLFGELFQGIEHLLARRRIERARRFVRHDDLGIFHERAGDGDALFLAARKGVRLALCKTRQVNLFENGVHRLFVLVLALQFEGERDVVFHRKLIEDIVFLEYKSDECVAVAVEVGLGKILAASAFDDDLAFVGCIQPAAEVEKGGLAAARFSERKDHAFFFEAYGYAVERPYFRAALRLVNFYKVLDFQHFAILSFQKKNLIYYISRRMEKSNLCRRKKAFAAGKNIEKYGERVFIFCLERRFLRYNYIL